MSTLSNLLWRRRNITKPLTWGARPFQSSTGKQLWARAPPFSEVSNFGRARPFQSSRQQGRAPLSVSKTKILSSLHFNWKFPLHTTWPGTSFFYLPQQLINPPPSHQGQRNPHTPPPLLSMVSSDAASWPQYGHPRVFSLQPVIDTATPFVVTTWTTPSGSAECWISKFPTVNSATFLERAPFKWACPFPSIRQTWARPFPSIRQTWACPFPSIRQTWARPSQKGAPFPIHQTVSQ